jgi:hypothetical protein
VLSACGFERQIDRHSPVLCLVSPTSLPYPLSFKLTIASNRITNGTQWPSLASGVLGIYVLDTFWAELIPIAGWIVWTRPVVAIPAQQLPLSMDLRYNGVSPLFAVSYLPSDVLCPTPILMSSLPSSDG